MEHREERNGVLRVAAVGDLHCKRTSENELRPLFEAASERADVLVLCGDVTDYGLPEEAQVLADALAWRKHKRILAANMRPKPARDNEQ